MESMPSSKAEAYTRLKEEAPDEEARAEEMMQEIDEQAHNESVVQEGPVLAIAIGERHHGDLSDVTQLMAVGVGGSEAPCEGELKVYAFSYTASSSKEPSTSTPHLDEKPLYHHRIARMPARAVAFSADATLLAVGAGSQDDKWVYNAQAAPLGRVWVYEIGPDVGRPKTAARSSGRGSRGRNEEDIQLLYELEFPFPIYSLAWSAASAAAYGRDWLLGIGSGTCVHVHKVTQLLRAKVRAVCSPGPCHAASRRRVVGPLRQPPRHRFSRLWHRRRK